MELKNILVAGGKELTEEKEKKREIAELLGEKIVSNPEWRLLTAGTRGVKEGEGKGGIDYHAAIGAQRALKNKTLEWQKILTIHPRSTDTEPFEIGRVIKSRAKTKEGRRFELVFRADAVVTIEGKETSKIIEYTIASGKSIIPIPCTGGASFEMWKTYRNELIESLRLENSDKEIEILESGLGTPALVVDTCMNILKKLLRPTCFILMPFSAPHSEKLYRKYLKKWLLERGYQPIRSDEVYSMSIFEDIENYIKKAQIIIADLTDLNPNVLFELGYAYALKKNIISIYKIEPNQRLEDLLPFDLRSFRILPFDPLAIDELKTLYFQR